MPPSEIKKSTWVLMKCQFKGSCTHIQHLMDSGEASPDRMKVFPSRVWKGRQHYSFEPSLKQVCSKCSHDRICITPNLHTSICWKGKPTGDKNQILYTVTKNRHVKSVQWLQVKFLSQVHTHTWSSSKNLNLQFTF